jgi:hypothetical protein
MRHSSNERLILGVAILSLGLAVGDARAETPLAGKWKATVVSEGKEIVLVLVQVEEKEGKPSIRVLGPGARKDMPVADVAVGPRSLRFTLRMQGVPFRMVGYVPKGEEKPKRLLGSVQPPGNAEPLVLERTNLTDLDEKEAEKDSPGFDQLERVLQEKDAQKREEGLKALRQKHAGGPVALAASEALVHIAAGSGASAEKIGRLADDYLQAAAVYGREMELHATSQVARGLLSTGEKTPLALEYAQKAEKQLSDDDPTETRAATLKLLARALEKSGKADKIRVVKELVARLDEQLDEEFEKNAIPFQLEAPPRRRRSSERVVLLELFTGAQCPPCVAADIAFDAVLKTYKPSEVVLLQYHLHVPGPDPLTNADSEARAEYYGKDIEGTPTAFLDGKPTEPLGGGAGGSKESYDTLRKQLDAALKKQAGARLQLDVRRAGEQIDLTAEVADLEKTGDRVRLHFVLVEEVVRYPGSNRQRLHHHVVRAFPGGVKGFALLDASAKKKASVNLAELRKDLGSYLDRAAKEQRFLDDERPMNLRHLKVVAFIQDDRSKEVLQAAQMDVLPAEK